MAKDTNKALQHQMIYSIYVRNHTEEGTFRALINDLNRIKDLGTDIIWFLPIHPIGVAGKKGTLGCPYANRDYRNVNPEYGTMDDFKELVDEIHKRNMKCMIDVVYNHTSPDSVLVKEHPEFFYKTPEGKFGNKVGDWSDVIDLDYTNQGLWDYQIESLKMWAEIVDGFRCDVASFVPVDFWKRARQEVQAVSPDCIWLAESVHMNFGNLVRTHGIYSAKDYELFEAFDLEYEYDIREVFDSYIKNEVSLSEYMNMINMQEAIYPDNYNKMRFLENHDQPRIAALVANHLFGGSEVHLSDNESDKIESNINKSDENVSDQLLSLSSLDDSEKTLVVNCLKNHLAFLFFHKGTALIYAGQEYADTRCPSLFEKEVINRETGINFSDDIIKLAKMKKELLDCEDAIFAKAKDDLDIACLERQNQTTKKIGIFSLKGQSGTVHVDAPDGSYENVISGTKVLVKDGLIQCEGEAIIFSFENKMTKDV